jgi:hypothetical protein
MKSKLISAAVLALAAFSSVGASAEMVNGWLFEQMAKPATRTRAEAKTEVLHAQQIRTNARQERPGSASAYNGALAQQNLDAAQVDKTGLAPQANAGFGSISQ